MGLTGFVIIHVFIASFSPAQGERNQMVNAKFTRPFNAMPKSNNHSPCILKIDSHFIFAKSGRVVTRLRNLYYEFDEICVNK